MNPQESQTEAGGKPGQAGGQDGPQGQAAGPAAQGNPRAATTSSLKQGADAAAGAAAAAMRKAAPWIARAASGLGDWLSSVGWGKFFLLSLLLIVFSSMASKILFSGSSGYKTSHLPEKIRVEVVAIPLSNGGLGIVAPDNDVIDRSSIQKNRGKNDDEGGFSIKVDPDKGDKTPSVRVNKDGVRVLADDDGKKVSVVIDHNGVRVEHLPAQGAGEPRAAEPAASAARAQGHGATARGVRAEDLGADAVILTPQEAADPQRVAQAVEAARDQIEEILQQQVDDRLDQLSEREGNEREDWFMGLTTMTIVALIALKIVLGSKSRAEQRARLASRTAAEEGLKRQLAEAQIKMMQAQVEPHFLFNTLASVDYLIETDPARASRMQKNLIGYLRAALPQMREDSSTLGRELQQCRSYLEILKVRMEERLQFSINVPQGLQSASFPPLMLLTLVENAIKHGLEPKPEGGTLAVSAVVADGALRVAVADTGMGFGAAQRGGTGVGLANVRERLRALYGEGAGLLIEANADGGTIATITVPYRTDAGVAGAGAYGGAAATATAV